ncbi:MAG: hypothetical protein ABUL58_06995, partial [Steroidobacter sp.]
MSQSVIADNWSLQNISELLLNGINPDFGHVVTPSIHTDSHRYDEIPLAAVAIEALFDLVTDVILRDQILVDDKFAGAWLKKGGPLNVLVKNSVVRTFPFLGNPEQLVGPREEFVARLCVTSSL